MSASLNITIREHNNIGHRVLTARRVPLVHFGRGTLPVQVVPELRAQLVSCKDEMCVTQFCTLGPTIQGL
jgi:hypothetical protein